MMSNALIIFIYSICAYGACNVIVFGSGPFKVFEGIRKLATRIHPHFGSMFNCMMCLPANFGWICSIVNWFFIPIAFTPFNILFAGYPTLWWLALLCDGAYTSGIVWLIHHVEEWFENMAEGTSPNSTIETTDETEDMISVDDITMDKQ